MQPRYIDSNRHPVSLKPDLNCIQAQQQLSSWLTDTSHFFLSKQNGVLLRGRRRAAACTSHLPSVSLVLADATSVTQHPNYLFVAGPIVTSGETPGPALSSSPPSPVARVSLRARSTLPEDAHAGRLLRCSVRQKLARRGKRLAEETPRGHRLAL